MVRSKEFDVDIAVQRAMELFWERGYEATGVADLVQHLGIARGSLYATFGSKDGLYQLALQRYCETEAGPVIDRLTEPGPVLPVLRAMLLRLAEAPAGDPRRRGCMVVNAAMERIPADSATAERVAAHLRKDEDVLAAALRRGRRSGEIPPGRDARALARFLVATIQGLRVVGKATADPATLRDVVAVALDAVGGPPPAHRRTRDEPASPAPPGRGA